MPQNCLNCQQPQEQDWILCPTCGLVYKCPSCGRALETTWTRCAFCAETLHQPDIVLESNAPANEPPLADRARIEDAKRQIQENHAPFFERWMTGRSIPYWVISIVFGELLFLAHYLLGRAVGIDVLGDTSWMLGAMIGVGMILVVSGTRNLRAPFEDLFVIVRLDVEDYASFYGDVLRFGLSDRNLLLCGFGFGLLNMGMGFVYGIWYEPTVLVVSLALQHFVIGFVCGLAVWGGLGGVTRLFRRAGKLALELDWDAPDGCFGTGFLGRKVLIDALYFFGLGILIATYVILSPWTRADLPLQNAMIWSWATFPYAIALVAFILPIIGIQRGIEAEKEARLAEIRDRRQELRAQIAALNDERDTAVLKRKHLAEEYDRAIELQERLSGASTWPYNIRHIAELVTTMLIPIALFLWDHYIA